MALTPEEVRWVAELARLDVGQEEIEELARQLTGILAHVEQLSVDDLEDSTGSDVAPAPDARAPLRADAPGADPLAGDLETLGTGWRDGFFTVPRMALHVESEDRSRDGSEDAS